MGLSKNAIKLLSWMNRNDKWKYYSELEKGFKKFEHRSFHALQSAKYIDECVFEMEIPEYDEYGHQYYPSHYRISDAGKAYLEGRFARWLPEFREWIAIGISIIALIVSVIALTLE